LGIFLNHNLPVVLWVKADPSFTIFTYFVAGTLESPRAAGHCASCANSWANPWGKRPMRRRLAGGSGWGKHLRKSGKTSDSGYWLGLGWRLTQDFTTEFKRHGR